MQLGGLTHLLLVDRFSSYLPQEMFECSSFEGNNT